MLAILVVLLAAAGTAAADEGRNVPAVGSRLTYRLVTTTTMPKARLTTGEVYTYIVTAADPVAAEGIIKPRAVIIYCKGAGEDPWCKPAAEHPGAHFDGELLTVPIADDVGDALAKQSAFKYAYFMQEIRKFPMPGARDLYGHDLGDIGPEPVYVLTNTNRCDFARLAGFLTSDTRPHVTLSCESITERSASRDPNRPPLTTRNKMSFAVSYTGDSSIALPSGTWEVKNLAFKSTPEDPSHITTEGENLFSPRLGVIVKTHLIGENASIQARSEGTTELISVEP